MVRNLEYTQITLCKNVNMRNVVEIKAVVVEDIIVLRLTDSWVGYYCR